jgi:hypothetical protein
MWHRQEIHREVLAGSIKERYLLGMPRGKLDDSIKKKIGCKTAFNLLKVVSTGKLYY